MRQEVRLWDLRADPPRQRAAVGQEPGYRGPGFPGRGLAFSPDGRTLACEEAGKGVRLDWIAHLAPAAIFLGESKTDHLWVAQAVPEPRSR
jgi:hypothetical protein